MKIRFKDGRVKALTLSYDDGFRQDKRLIEIMDKNGLKGTFNINSGESVRKFIPDTMELSEAKSLYINSGHEVAIHTLTHQHLERMDSTEIITEIVEDRKNIEKEYGVIARGMAYPYGTYNDLIIDILDKCHIAYARTTKATHSFNLPENWLTLHPTCHHNDEKLTNLAERFVEKHNKWGYPELFYLWGHSNEFDRDNNWSVIENFAKYIGGRDNIWYATNIEIYDYVKAFERLHTSFDKRIIHNPSACDVWFEAGGEVHCVRAGETISL